MTPRTLTAALAALTAITAACGGNTPHNTPTAPTQLTAPHTANTQPTPPLCVELFIDGEIPNLDQTGDLCTRQRGDLVNLPYLTCPDTTRLYTIDEPVGWFITGKPFHATPTEISRDPGYGAAYQACQ